jgi:uncharacterized protein (TIGR02117 family)
MALPVMVALYFAASLIGAVLPGETANTPAGRSYEIGLIAGPIHYDFLLPLDADTRARFVFTGKGGVRVDHPDAAWLVIGWGARAFYTTAGSYRDVRAGAVLRGIFGDDAVVRVDVAGPLENAPDIQFIAMSEAQYAAFLTHILAAFKRGDDGEAIHLPGTHFSQTDAFFEARGRFSVFRTCNAWVGESLRAAGLGFGLWTPTPQAIRVSLWRFGF